MIIDNTPQYDFNNVLIKPKKTKITSRSQVDLVRSFTFKNSTSTWSGIPIMAANMDTTGTFEIARVLSKNKMLTCLHKFYRVVDYSEFFKLLEDEERVNMYNNIAVSSGISDKDFDKLCEIMDTFPELKWICIDVANGYMEKMIEYCRKVRERYPKSIIIAGNIATSSMTKMYIEKGLVDIVKVGIGPGSACLTRLKTGVGVPQLSAIIECGKQAHHCGGHIVGDGGITCPGDMAKAFGGGADFVMCGGVFSGHDENPGEIIETESKTGESKKFKLFYGMSSEHAMKKHYGKMEKYRSSEGRCIKVPYKGPLEKTVCDYLGGIRSTCAYVNVNKLEDLYLNVTFLLVSQQLNTHLVK